jgi:hypothetical protein
VKHWTRAVRAREAERKRAQRQVAEFQEIYRDVVKSCQDLERIQVIEVLSRHPRKSLQRRLESMERKLYAAQNAESTARRNLSNARLCAGRKACSGSKPSAN